jgi:predicted MPP superfamily phosphohydrolase
VNEDRLRSISELFPPLPVTVLVLSAFLIAWVGHAYLWTALLNYVYARPYPKAILKPWRHFTGIVILAFPFLVMLIIPSSASTPDGPHGWFNGALGFPIFLYACSTCLIGLFRFPYATVVRLSRKPPKCIVNETTTTLDLKKELGPEVVGDGKGRGAAKLPFNCIFKVDFTELTLALPNLPPALDGLTILHLTDVHYHGTPSRSFHERVVEEIQKRWPEPDLVCLTGDYVDTDHHREWIKPLLGRFRGKDGNFAILGNHDQQHHPEQVRASLADAGYTVVGNSSLVANIRGVPCRIAGHEGPWFRPAPKLEPSDAAFQLLLSHSPDNIEWAARHGFNLMLCGHVHGGQIRVPVITSIFVPSIYGREFDMGVFERGGTTMVVGRGLSGKEPLRFRCHPQVMLVKLTKAG